MRQPVAQDAAGANRARPPDPFEDVVPGDPHTEHPNGATISSAAEAWQGPQETRQPRTRTAAPASTHDLSMVGWRPRFHALRWTAEEGRTAQTLAVETHGLTKRYSTGVLAVDGLDLRVRSGEVYGFLGPNGAGKTTTLRLLSGLLHPTSGTAIVAGAAPGSPASLARMGAMVETPAFYPYLSGRDNLRVVARYASVSASRIEPVLKLVDLTDRARHKFKTYSTGMKQRLGVAAALLKAPDLLILDEPTSGLDPQGTIEMRALIKELKQGGRTVLLSSHLLNEVELTCDRVGVIAKGQLVAEGTVDDLAARSGGRTLRIRATPLEQAQRLLESLLPEQVRVIDGSLILNVDPAQAASINRRLVSEGIDVSELRVDEQSLEDVFLQLTETPTLPSPATGEGISDDRQLLR